MTTEKKSNRLGDLIRLLGTLQSLYEQLLTTVQSKIESMRRADLEKMQELEQQERELTERLKERDGLRRQLMGEVARELGLRSGADRALTVSGILSHVQESARAGLVEAAQGLRGAVAKVARANRVAGVISRELLNHLQWVFASVRPAANRASGYAGDGAVVADANDRIFEVVG